MTNKGWDIIHSKYIASAVRPEQYPHPELTEVAFDSKESTQLKINSNLISNLI